MKVAGVVFSARKTGNGFSCIRYCLDRLEGKGFKTVLINAFDYEIKPCSHCNYECYAKTIRGREEQCPIEDDVPKLYETMKATDLLLFAIPTYGGRVPGIFQAFRERTSGLSSLFKDFEEFQRGFLNKIKGIIVIGHLTAGGDMALHEVLTDFYNIEQPEVILLQADEFGRRSLKGDLIESRAVRQRLDRFVELVTKGISKRKMEGSA